MLNLKKAIVVTLILSIFGISSLANAEETAYVWMDPKCIQERIENDELPEIKGTVYSVTYAEKKSMPTWDSKTLGIMYPGDKSKATLSQKDWTLLSDGSWVYSGYLSKTWHGTWTVFYDDISMRYVSKTYDLIQKLPRSAKDVLSKYKLTITSEPITMQEYEGKYYKDVLILGVTHIEYPEEGNPKQIFVRSDPDTMDKTFFHEVGHAVYFENELYNNAYVQNLLSSSANDILRSIQSYTVSGLTSLNLKNDTNELFAESFRMYIQEPEILHNISENLYMFIEDIMGFPTAVNMF